MGRSKPIYKPRCSKCGSKNPTPISVKNTNNHDYVRLKCNCGHEWVSTGESAFRLSVTHGLAKYKS